MNPPYPYPPDDDLFAAYMASNIFAELLAAGGGDTDSLIEKSCYITKSLIKGTAGATAVSE
jgi:hypothetical protein